MSEFFVSHPWMTFALGVGVLWVVYDGIANICNTYLQVKLKRGISSKSSEPQ